MTYDDAKIDVSLPGSIVDIAFSVTVPPALACYTLYNRTCRSQLRGFPYHSRELLAILSNEADDNIRKTTSVARRLRLTPPNCKQSTGTSKSVIAGLDGRECTKRLSGKL